MFPINLSQNELTYLNSIADERNVLPETKIIFVPSEGMDPRTILMGKNQPDMFRGGLQRPATAGAFCAGTFPKCSTPSMSSPSFLSAITSPGNLAGKIYYLPFRLRWQALLYNTERVSEAPADMAALGDLCKNHPGGLVWSLGDDDVLVKFMLSVIWAFNGNEFNLENEQTKQALYFFSSLSSCLSPYAGNYDAESLADALARGEIDFAFAEMNTTVKLWQSGSYPYPVDGAAFPGTSAIAFTGTYLGINKQTRKPNESYALGFYLTEPQTCEKVIQDGLWLCDFPAAEKPNLPPARVGLFKPFLASAARVRPVPPEVEFASLAKIYRELFTRLAVKSEQVELVSAELSLNLKQLAPGQ